MSVSEDSRVKIPRVLHMARELLVRSVAEGVETQRDWDGLKVVGCDTVQGYFVARPMDEAAFHSFVADFVPL
ncbi:MAG: EAL domain-containing protein [Pseudomonadota bacterium]